MQIQTVPTDIKYENYQKPRIGKDNTFQLKCFNNNSDKKKAVDHIDTIFIFL